MKFPTLDLGSRMVSSFSEPYVIAEIGVNHEGSMDRAIELIRLAKESGANAAKFQSYKAEQLAAVDSPAYWDLEEEPTETQFELFKKYDSFGANEFEVLARYCREIGIDFLSTPFDPAWVPILDPLVPFFKVASADLTNVPLLRAVAQTRKPTVLSTGACSLEEIRWAVDFLISEGSSGVALLHCVLSYPTRDEDAHLGMILGLRKDFEDLVIGYSDHTLPTGGLPSLREAWLLGAAILEKHFTDDKSGLGNDHYHAMNKEDLEEFLERLKETRSRLGGVAPRRVLTSEEVSRVQARRSIYSTASLTVGTSISAEMMTVKRPGIGISPVEWDSLIGKILKNDVAEGQPFSRDDFFNERE